MSMKTISPEKARALLNQGAALVDIRATDEHARERIAQAKHIPLESVDPNALRNLNAQTIIFHCRSGNRTQAHAATLASCSPCEAYILEGGLDAWKKAGLPVEKDASQPLELSRQVQIAAGTFVLLGVILGTWVSAWFYLLSAFIGGGLVFAGVTGTCALARVLLKMPWNARPQAA